MTAWTDGRSGTGTSVMQFSTALAFGSSAGAHIGAFALVRDSGRELADATTKRPAHTTAVVTTREGNPAANDALVAASDRGGVASGRVGLLGSCVVIRAKRGISSASLAAVWPRAA